MRKLLVPTDFSKEADVAFHLANQISENIEAEIYLLHIADLPVVTDPMGTNLNAYFTTDLMSQMEENMKKKMEKYALTNSNKLHKNIIWGNVTFSINNFVRENFIDLVIMGTKGASGMKELIVGSNTEKVIRKCDCPVLSIKNKMDFNQINKIVWGIAPFEKQSEEFIQKLGELQTLFDAEINVVFVNTPSNYKKSRVVLDKIKNIVEKNNIKNYTVDIVNDVYEEDGLRFFADTKGGDIFALGTHGRRGLGHLIYGSIAEDINNHVERPIWTYKIN